MSKISVFHIVILIICCDILCSYELKKISYYDPRDYALVKESEVYPYMAAILKKSSYLCAGALIDESWVLTAADSLFLLRDSLRLLRVRLGSTNNRRGGVQTPVKLFEIHPYFNDENPDYDLALIRLAKPVRFTPTLNPIRLQKKLREPTAPHFTVTSWPTQLSHSAETQKMAADSIKRRRTLTVAHLHPTAYQNCSDQLEDITVTRENLMCLEPPLGSDPCLRDAGAPVVLNGILWGIVSSWKPEDCDLEAVPSLVTLVAAPNASTWIQATIRGKSWNQRRSWIEMMDYDDDYTEV